MTDLREAVSLGRLKPPSGDADARVADPIEADVDEADWVKNDGGTIYVMNQSVWGWSQTASSVGLREVRLMASRRSARAPKGVAPSQNRPRES